MAWAIQQRQHGGTAWRTQQDTRAPGPPRRPLPGNLPATTSSILHTTLFPSRTTKNSPKSSKEVNPSAQPAGHGRRQSQKHSPLHYHSLFNACLQVSFVQPAQRSRKLQQTSRRKVTLAFMASGVQTFRGSSEAASGTSLPVEAASHKKPPQAYDTATSPAYHRGITVV